MSEWGSALLSFPLTRLTRPELRHLCTIPSLHKSTIAAQKGGAYAAEDAQGPRGPGQMAGYRAVAFKNGTPSMLASIGASVARNIGNAEGGGGAGGGGARPTRRETLEEARSKSKASWTAPPPGTLPGYTGSMR